MKVLRAVYLRKEVEADITQQPGLGLSHHLAPFAQSLPWEPDESAEPQV